MYKSETLIILDWDDTLFPTSWILKNNIDIESGLLSQEYMKHFMLLDKLLYNLLSKLLLLGKVVIVTNALLGWIKVSGITVPNTYKLIVKGINVISARGAYQKEFPYNIYKWKDLAFKREVAMYYMKKYNIHNIISVGDADYEYQALIGLSNWKNLHNKKVFLKSIKFKPTPNFDVLTDELEVLNKNISHVWKAKKHYDLVFNDK